MMDTTVLDARGMDAHPCNPQNLELDYMQPMDVAL